MEHQWKKTKKQANIWFKMFTLKQMVLITPAVSVRDPNSEIASPLRGADYCRNPVSSVFQLMLYFFIEAWSSIFLKWQFYLGYRPFLWQFIFWQSFENVLLDLGTNTLLNGWQHSRASRNCSLLEAQLTPCQNTERGDKSPLWTMPQSYV